MRKIQKESESERWSLSGSAAFDSGSAADIHREINNKFLKEKKERERERNTERERERERERQRERERERLAAVPPLITK